MTAPQKPFELDDDALVALAVQELPYVTRSYELLMRRHYRLILKSSQRMLRNPDEAEEATQDIMLKVFNALPRFESRASFKTWLLKITTNTCITRSRRRRFEAERFVSDGDSSLPEFRARAESDPAESAQDDFEILTRGLSPEELQLLTLRFIGDLNLDEIAEILGLGLSATKMRYYRSLDKLKSAQEPAARLV